jgi:hypothetical protein
VAAHDKWALNDDIAADLLYDIDDSEPICPKSSFGAEGTLLEIETGTCEYATFTQPVQVAIRAGDTVEYLVWHLNLWDETPGEAHVAIHIGDWLMWEQFIDVPADAHVYDGSVESPYDIPEGTAYLHLHNHGVNSWRVANVTRVVP